MSARIELKDSFKTYTLDQDKVLSPQETVARLRERLAQVRLDVLQKTVRIDHGRLDIPVFVSLCGSDALKVMPTKKQMGKGATPAQAEASAVMELVERYSFFSFRREGPFVRASYSEVQDRALPLAHLAASVHHDPEDLDRAWEAVAGLELLWAPALNLTRGREDLVPFDWFYQINEFNGPAAGNTLEEAIIQGLAEVVERHVSALVCRGRPELPGLETASLKNPVARELVAKYERCGIQLFLKDFTLDMGLASVGALAYDPATFPHLSEIVFTAGTATDPEKALIRALTEVAQLAGDFNSRSNFVASGLPKYTDLAQAEYVTREAPRVPLSALPDLSDNNLKVEIERAVAALARRGFEVYVLNLTHPRLQIPAVYTLVPGAHFRERAAASSVPFFAGKIVARQSDLAQAAAGLERLRRLYPETYYLNFFLAEAYLNRGRPAEAVPLLEAALKLNPQEEDLPGLLTYLGLAYKEMGDLARAIPLLERSAALDADRRDTFNLLGFCYFKTGRYEESIAAFQRVLKLDPGSGIDYANIGSNYREMGRLEEAAHHYKTALELDPSLDWVRENLARLAQWSA